MLVIGALKPPLAKKETVITNRLLPERIDNTYHGYRPALWLFALIVSVKILQGLMVIFNGPSIAVSADGIPLDTYSPQAAQTVLALFAISGLARLIMSLIGVLALVRYRSAIPFMFALLGFDYLARQLVLNFIPIVRTGKVPGPAIKLVLFALTIVGLVLSLRSRDNLEARYPSDLLRERSQKLNRQASGPVGFLFVGEDEQTEGARSSHPRRRVPMWQTWGTLFPIR